MQSTLTFRRIVAALALAALGSGGAAQAQGYPSKPITLVVPFATGSGGVILGGSGGHAAPPQERVSRW